MQWLCYQFCFCVSLSFGNVMVSGHLVVFETCSISQLPLHYLCCRNFLQYSLFCPSLISDTNCSASKAVQCEWTSWCTLFSFSGIEWLPAWFFHYQTYKKCLSVRVCHPELSFFSCAHPRGPLEGCASLQLAHSMPGHSCPRRLFLYCLNEIAVQKWRK